MQEDYYQQIDFEQEEQETIRTTLTPEQIECAFAYLKKKFAYLPLEKVVNTLDRFIHKPKQPQRPRVIPRQLFASHANANVNVRPRGLQNIQMNEAHLKRGEDKHKAKQYNKIVGLSFCEVGYDYQYVKKFVPEMSLTSYRNTLNSIINSTFNELLKLLKIQCQVNIELNTFQKQTIKLQLVHAHRWMGQASLSAMKTFLELLRTRIEQVRLSFADERLSQLYSVIARRVSDNYVDIADIDEAICVFEDGAEDNKKNPNHIVAAQDVMMARFTIDEEEMLGNSFIKYQDLEKMEEVFSVIKANNKKWNRDGIRVGLSAIFKKSIKQLMKNMGNQEAARSLNFFDIDENIGKNVMQRGRRELQLELVQYFFGKNGSKSGIESTLKHLNDFMDDQAQHNHIMKRSKQKEKMEDEQGRNLSRRRQVKQDYNDDQFVDNEQSHDQELIHRFIR